MLIKQNKKRTYSKGEDFSALEGFCDRNLAIIRVYVEVLGCWSVSQDLVHHFSLQVHISGSHSKHSCAIDDILWHSNHIWCVLEFWWELVPLNCDGHCCITELDWPALVICSNCHLPDINISHCSYYRHPLYKAILHLVTWGILKAIQYTTKTIQYTLYIYFNIHH